MHPSLTPLREPSMRYPFAAKIIEKIAPALGIRVELEPEFQFAGELIWPDGRRHIFKNTNFNINAAGSHDIAKDKAYTKHFLQRHGLNTPKWRTVFSPRLCKNLAPEKRRSTSHALEFANQIGYPVFIKPNHLSQGVGVFKAYNREDLGSFCEQLFALDDVLLVEAAFTGRDYRVVVLDDQIISAYERRPFTVVGDGVSSIDQLIDKARSGLQTQNRPNSEIDPEDARIDIRLRELQVSRQTIPQLDQAVVLLDNANLSTGGQSTDVTNIIHSEFAQIARRARQVLGLRLAGVDILCNDLSQSPHAQDWTIIELNASPGLDNYAALGAEQQQRVEDLYRRILLAL